ncbi:MFS transporter [Frankia gtarii]|uniref:MFS transporter n=1 Tax=Frankia gtarii TaxID=2950102 RepID=UPI0021C0E373|nr:MFS transporter [Frankia gtarii]
MRELLRDGTYLRYWLAVVVSFLGDGIVRVTVIYIMAGLSDSPALLIALAVVAQLLPAGALGAFVGPLVDRISPRVLLVGADLARIVIVLLMIICVHSAGGLLALILLEGIGRAVFETARMAAIPKVVGGHNIGAAIALFQSTVQTVNLIGPLIGGALIAVAGTRIIFVLDAVTFAVSAVLLGSLAVLRGATTTAGGPGAYLSSLRTGAGEVLRIPSLRLVAWAMVPVMLAMGVFTTNINVQLLDDFRLPPFDYGLGQGMVGGGAIVGALLGPTLIRRYSLNALLAAAVALFAVALLVLWPIDATWPAGGTVAVVMWCALAGLATSLVQVPVANILLRDLPEDLRGRGIALLNAVMVNFTVLGVILGGVLADTAGSTLSLVLAGAVLVPPAIVLAATDREVAGPLLSGVNPRS